MRRLIMILTALAIFLLVNYIIWHREEISSNGRTILLELAPVDPRSLMQGDYMALRFRLADEAFPRNRFSGLRDGGIVLALDSNNIGTFRRFEDGTSIAADEALLRYRIRKGQPKFATNAFFFQEGQGGLYRNAKYGEFRASSDGEAILIAMRDAKLQTLEPNTGEQAIDKSMDNKPVRQKNTKKLNSEKMTHKKPIPRKRIIIRPGAELNTSKQAGGISVNSGSIKNESTKKLNSSKMVNKKPIPREWSIITPDSGPNTGELAEGMFLDSNSLKQGSTKDLGSGQMVNKKPAPRKKVIVTPSVVPEESDHAMQQTGDQ
jgi:uncharacterized membrane-anchored protein